MRCVTLLFLSILCLMPSAFSKESLFDKPIKKIAGDLVREYPELAKGKRRSQARDEFCKEIADIIGKSLHKSAKKQLERRKSIVQEDLWKELLQKCKLANFKGKRESFYLQQASEENLPADRQFILYQLLKHHYDLVYDSRESENQSRMRSIGKAFTAYFSQHKKAPESLADFVTTPKWHYGIDPATGEEHLWIYTAPYDYDLRGTNRKRVILASNIPTGKNGVYRWVVYKGGTYGTWKTATLDKELAKLATFIEEKQQPPKKAKKTEKSKKATTTKKKTKRTRKTLRR